MAEKECPFCNLEKEKDRIIRFSPGTAALLSNPRLMPGHTLIVPKRHVEDPSNLSLQELFEIWNQIKWVKDKLLASDLADGTDIRQHYHPFLKQNEVKVDHVHFHVLPRKLNDDFYKQSPEFEIDFFKKLTKNEAEKIRDVFN